MNLTPALEEKLRRVVASAPTLTAKQAALITRLTRQTAEPIAPADPGRAA